MIGDHHQLPPVVKNMAFQKYAHLDQSLFTRFVRLGIPYLELNAQVRLHKRPETPACRGLKPVRGGGRADASWLVMIACALKPEILDALSPGPSPSPGLGNGPAMGLMQRSSSIAAVVNSRHLVHCTSRQTPLQCGACQAFVHRNPELWQ